MVHSHLLSEVKLTDEQIQQVKVSTVEEQVDEAQHGRGTHHLTCEVGQPHHRLDDSHRDEVQTWECGDHGVPLQQEQNILHRLKKFTLLI